MQQWVHNYVYYGSRHVARLIMRGDAVCFSGFKEYSLAGSTC